MHFKMFFSCFFLNIGYKTCFNIFFYSYVDVFTTMIGTLRSVVEINQTTRGELWKKTILAFLYL